MSTPKEDCFAYQKRFLIDTYDGLEAYCSVLTEMLCAKGECSFYKSKKRYKDDRVRHRSAKDNPELYFPD